MKSTKFSAAGFALRWCGRRPAAAGVALQSIVTAAPAATGSMTQRCQAGPAGSRSPRISPSRAAERLSSTEPVVIAPDRLTPAARALVKELVVPVAVVARLELLKNGSSVMKRNVSTDVVPFWASTPAGPSTTVELKLQLSANAPSIVT